MNWAQSFLHLASLCFSFVFIGEEVVDLTCEGSEPPVVDLTNNDSVVVSLLHFFFFTLHKKFFLIYVFTFMLSIEMPL